MPNSTGHTYHDRRSTRHYASLRPTSYFLPLTSRPYSLTPSFLFTFVFVAVLTLYLVTLAPGVVGGDAGEHQFVAPLLGIPHATGYPLYTLFGKLWTLLIPFGSMAWRMNLLSAVGGALAAAITALVVYNLSFQTRRPIDDGQRTTDPESHIEPPTVRATHYALRNKPHPPPLWAGAVVAGLALSFGLTLWQWSIIAGVRSINVLFFALLTLLAMIWQQQRQCGDVQAAERTLRWLALAVGLSLAHHRTTVFYLPSLIGWMGWHDRHLIFQPKRLLPLILLSLAPLSLYAFIYFRGINQPPYSHEEITDLQSFWFLAGAGDSSGLFFSIDPAFLPARLGFIWRDIVTQLSMPGVILAALGALLLLWQQTKHFFSQGLLVLLLLLFTLDFEVVNLNEAPTWYLMPAYFIFAVWSGIGVNGVLDFGFWILRLPLQPRSGQGSGQVLDFGLEIREKKPTGEKVTIAPTPHPPRITHHASRITPLTQLLTATITIVVLAYSLAWPNWQKIYAASVAPLDEWRQLLRGTQAQRLVESSLPYVKPNSLILGDWEQYTPFMYYQLINGMRPDVTPRLPLNRWPEQVAEARADGKPVYFTRKTADLIGTPHLSMAGPLIHLGTEPQFEAPAGIITVNANFENELELIGYRAEVIPQPTPGGKRAGPIIQLTFYWRVPHKVKWDYALSLRLLDADGREIYRRDATHPVLSSYPTTLWTPGEVVGDFYELPFPPGSGPLTLHLLPYRTEGAGKWHNLTPVGAGPGQEGILLGPFEEK